MSSICVTCAPLKFCGQVLTSSTQRQNRSFVVFERTRTAMKCTEKKNSRAQRAKLLFFIVKYANCYVIVNCTYVRGVLGV